jgi:hypothetical protein
MVTKTKKFQIFWKPHKITILDRFSKAITLEHSEDFNFQGMPFSIFDLYPISKDILMWHISSFIGYGIKQISKISSTRQVTNTYHNLNKLETQNTLSYAKA